MVSALKAVMAPPCGTMCQIISLVSHVSTVDHLPDKETRKRKPKKTFEIDFNDDVNFDTYFRTTRVRTLLVSPNPRGERHLVL